MTDDEDLGEPVVCYPCFILQGKSGPGTFMPLTLKDGRMSIVILTDEDAMDRYRREVGLVDHGALRLNTPQQLLMRVCDTPAAITHVTIDPCGNPLRGPTISKRAFVARLSAEVMGF